MSNRNDVMDLLATSRPAYFDDPGDLHRRRSDIEQAISAPLPQGFSAEPTPITGLLRRSRPLTIGIAAAATVAAVTIGSTVIFAKHNVAGPAAGGDVLSSPTKGTFLVASSESSSYATARLNGTNVTLREVHRAEIWLPRRAEDPNYTSETSAWFPADATAVSAWKQAGSPKEVPVGFVKNNRFEPNTTVRVNSWSTENYVHGVDYGAGSGASNCKGADECTRLYGDAKAMIRQLNRRIDSRFAFEVANVKDEKTPDEKSGEVILPVSPQVRRAKIAFNYVGAMLADPMPQKSRLALVRLLDQISDIKKVGPVTDQKGRPGTGYITTHGTVQGARGQDRLIIDSKTGELLALERRDYSTKMPVSASPNESTVYLGVKWSNAKPPTPNVKFADGTKG